MLIFQKVKNGGMSICVNCSHRKVCKGIDNQPCVECNQFFNEDKQPQTNADRIRAMSDEELAELLSDDERACPPRHRNCRKHITECGGCWLEWLKQPVRED